ILEIARGIAQGLELRQSVHRLLALDDELSAHVDQRLLQVLVLQRALHIVLEEMRGRLHRRYCPSPIAGSCAMPASTSATWRASTLLPLRFSLPAMLSRQPMSAASTTPAPVASMLATLSSTMRLEMSGDLTQKVPPKPQHGSPFGSSLNESPLTFASNSRGWGVTRSSRSGAQE